MTAFFGQNNLDARAPAARRNARRLLGAFLAGSVAAHAALLVALPGFSPDREQPKVNALEVVILQPEPLPVALPESTPQPAPLSGAERVPARALPKPQPERTAPILALPEPRATEGSFTVPPDSMPELPVAVPEQRSRVASATMTPPTFNAAYLSNPAPRYPVAARRADEQGTVTLRVLVTREGLPARVDVEKSSGSSHLDAAALEAVKAWRFVPARRGTEAIESWVLVPIVFRLEGAS